MLHPVVEIYEQISTQNGYISSNKSSKPIPQIEENKTKKTVRFFNIVRNDNLGKMILIYFIYSYGIDCYIDISNEMFRAIILTSCDCRLVNKIFSI